MKNYNVISTLSIILISCSIFLTSCSKDEILSSNDEANPIESTRADIVEVDDIPCREANPRTKP